MNGAQSLFQALVDAGVTTCFANPGTSEMQLVYEIGMTDKVRPILCLQEDVVTGAADGYGRMKGSPAFTLLHVGSGFANGIAMLHNAGRANTPIVNVVGQCVLSSAELSGTRVDQRPRYGPDARCVPLVAGGHAARPNWANSERKRQRSRRPEKFARLLRPPIAIGKTPIRRLPSRPALSFRRSPRRRSPRRGPALEWQEERHRTRQSCAPWPGPDAAARVAAKTGATLLSETFPSRYLARGEGGRFLRRSL